MLAVYIALYRRWRPQNFSAIVGQKHITRILRHSLQESRLAHAYLFSGPRGTGKTSTAKIFAKALNCLSLADGEPCGYCSNCQSISSGSFLDIMEMDAASHRRIDDVRELQERLPFGPVQGRYKVYIIDEVHMLTTEAFNALLKTLEEPPSHVVFLLATTEPQKMPQTVLSRCLRLDFHPLTPQEIGDYLQTVAQGENIKLEERAAWALARQARGALRDALSLMEECAAYTGSDLTEADVRLVLGILSEDEILSLGRSLWEGSPSGLMEMLSQAWERGKQPVEIIRELLSYLRDLITLKLCPGRFDLLHFSPASGREMESQAGVELNRLFQAVEVLSRLENDIRLTGRPEILIELALLEISTESGQSEERLTAIEQRLSRLEKALSGSVRPQYAQSLPVKTRVDEKPSGSVPAKSKPFDPDETSSLDETNKRSQAKPVRGRQSVLQPETIPNDVTASFKPVSEIKWWPQILELAKRKQRTCWVMLSGVKAIRSHDSHLQLGLTEGYMKDQLEKQANREVAEEIFTRLCKRKVKLDIYLLNETENAEAVPQDPRESEIRLRDAALRLFGGSIIKKGEEDWIDQ